MKVCAVSDLHGRLPELPSADLLVIAGDICPDAHGSVRGIIIADPDAMRVEQMHWLETEFAPWLDRHAFARVMVTPGNHDFITKLPENVNAHFFVDELVEWQDKRFYFTPWVNPCGPWNYQLDRARRKLMFADIPEGLDLLVSHGPALDCGDRTYGNNGGTSAGCPELRQVVQQTRPRFMVFGHIHEGQRFGRTHSIGATTCFNVAMWGVNWEPLTFEL